MRGSAALEADEETLAEATASVSVQQQAQQTLLLENKRTRLNGGGTSTTTKNGTKNGGNSSNDVKYPANCALRLGSTIPGSTDGGGDDNDIYEPKPNKKIIRIITVMVYVFTVSFGAILLSLYYLFLWDPYKNTGPPTQRPSAQTNSPPTPSTSASIKATASISTVSPVNPEVGRRSTLSDTTLDNLVKDLNAGAEPKTLALAIKAMADQEMLSKGHGKKVLVEDPFVTFAKAQRAKNKAKTGLRFI